MKLLTLLGTVSIGAILSVPAEACSICRCGDPTFNALGKEGIAQTGLRLAVDWDQVDKTQGSQDDAFDELHEQRITLLAAYAVSDRVNIFARVPYSQRELTETEEGESERTRHSGLADPEIYGQTQIWASKFDGAVGIRSAIFAVVGVKTDWGENDATRDGERLDEHVQAGTGSTDWFGGLSGSYQIDPHSAIFASAQYRHTGRNDFGYRYGRITLFNVAYEHKLGARWDAVLEANYRYAQHDQVDSSGTLDSDTGGSIMYLTPRLLFDAGGGWVLRASAQLPLSDSGLNGNQDEKAVLNFGITYLMNR
jgi:hypothetical protein